MAALPTTIEPTYAGTNKTTKTRVRRMQFGDGYSQRSADGINTVVQEWQVEWIGTTSQIDELEAFLEARGGYEAFTWTPKREASPRQFSCQEWSRTYVANGTDSLSAKFMEEFDL